MENYHDTLSLITEKKWEQIINDIVRKGNQLGATREDKERLSFYRARNLIYHALTYIAFIPNRYCVLQRDDNSPAYTIGNRYVQPNNRFKQKILVELSKITQDLSMRKTQPLEEIFSCWSDNSKTIANPFVQKYISFHYPDFHLQKEVGHFLWPHSLPDNTPYVDEKLSYQNRYRGTLFLRWSAIATLSLTELFFPIPNPKNV